MVVKRLENIWFSREKAGGKKIKTSAIDYTTLLLVMLYFIWLLYAESGPVSQAIHCFVFFVFLFFYFPARLFPTFTAGYLKCS